MRNCGQRGPRRLDLEVDGVDRSAKASPGIEEPADELFVPVLLGNTAAVLVVANAARTTKTKQFGIRTVTSTGRTIRACATTAKGGSSDPVAVARCSGLRANLVARCPAIGAPTGGRATLNFDYASRAAFHGRSPLTGGLISLKRGAGARRARSPHFWTLARGVGPPCGDGCRGAFAAFFLSGDSAGSD